MRTHVYTCYCRSGYRDDYGSRGGPPPYDRYGPGPPPGRGPPRPPRDGRRRDEGPPGVSLLVRNVSGAITTEDLQHAFGRIGEVRDVYIPRDYHSQQPKGFAFIEYATPEMAAEAREEMDRFKVRGRELEVVFAQERRKTPNEMRGRVGTGSGSGGGGSTSGGHVGRGPAEFERSSSFERHRQRQRDGGRDRDRDRRQENTGPRENDRGAKGESSKHVKQESKAMASQDI
jgi:FUS-interacting serine-arginine-rich protein 1